MLQWYGQSLLILPWRLGFGLGLGIQGKPILLGFWERGCPKSRDARITVTVTRGKKMTRNFTAN